MASARSCTHQKRSFVSLPFKLSRPAHRKPTPYLPRRGDPGVAVGQNARVTWATGANSKAWASIRHFQLAFGRREPGRDLLTTFPADDGCDTRLASCPASFLLPSCPSSIDLEPSSFSNLQCNGLEYRLGRGRQNIFLGSCVRLRLDSRPYADEENVSFSTS